MKANNQKSHSVRNRPPRKLKKEVANGKLLSITIRNEGSFLEKKSNLNTVKISRSSKNSRSPNPKNNSETKITMNIKKIADRKLGLLKPLNNLNKRGRRSFNIRIDQRFNIQLSPGISPKSSFFNRHGRLGSRTTQFEQAPKLKIPSKSYKSKILEAEKRVDFVKRKIDKSLSKYYTRKCSRGNEKVHGNDSKSPMSSVIIRDSLRDKRRRDLTDKRLKVNFRATYVFELFINLYFGN